MNNRFYPLLFVLSLCLIVTSCKKPKANSGTAELSYKSGAYLDLLTNYKVLIGGGATSKVYVENADPYRDLIGEIIHTIPETNGASNLILNDLTCTSIYMDCRDEIELSSKLVDARLVAENESTGERTVLADLSNFDTTTKLLNFNVNSGDYSDYFADFSSKELFFEFDLTGLPATNVGVSYEVKVSAAYTFEL